MNKHVESEVHFRIYYGEEFFAHRLVFIYEKLAFLEKPRALKQASLRKPKVLKGSGF